MSEDIGQSPKDEARRVERLDEDRIKKIEKAVRKKLVAELIDNTDTYIPEVGRIKAGEVQKPGELVVLQKNLEGLGAKDSVELEAAKAEISERVRETTLYEEISRIRETKLSAEDIEMAEHVIDVFNQDTELTAGVIEGICTFQETRLRELLPMNSQKRVPAIAHELSVSSVIALQSESPVVVPISIYDKARGRGLQAALSEEDKLLQVVATAHDIVKYMDRNLQEAWTFLGLHESASAIVMGQVMQSVLSEKNVHEALLAHGEISEENIDDHIEAVVKLAEIAVAGHGRDEFPYEMALNPKRGGMVVDSEIGLHCINLGPKPTRYLYLEPPSVEDVFESDVGEAERKIAERFIEGLRQADMVEGVLMRSYIKYLGEASPGRVASFEHFYDYMDTLNWTFFQYGRAMPRALELDTVIKENRVRVGLLNALVNRAGEGEESLQDFFDSHAEVLGEETTRELVRLTRGLENAFNQKNLLPEKKEGKEGKEKHEKNMALWKNLLEIQFGALVETVGKVPVEKLETKSDLRTEIYEVLTGHEVHVRLSNL